MRTTWTHLFWPIATGLVVAELVFSPGLSAAHRALAGTLFFSLGLPHGALDLWIWKRSAPARSKATFYGGYLGGMALMALLWVVSPWIAFMAFLAMAVHHFGEGDFVDDEAPARLQGSRGLLVVGLPIVLHSEAVVPVVAAMGVDRFALPSPWGLVVATGLVAQHVLVSLEASPAGLRTRRLVDAALLTMLFAVLHPLVSFAVYFTLGHALEHLRSIRHRLGTAQTTTWHLFVMGLPFAIAATSGLVGFILTAPTELDMHIWIGRALVFTSVLTLPHAVLVSMSRRSTAEKPTPPGPSAPPTRPLRPRPRRVRAASDALPAGAASTRAHLV